MDEIKADYDLLEQVANLFTAQSQAVQQILQDVKGCVDPLVQGGWMGRGSESFYAEMDGMVLPATLRLQQALEEANQVTKQISQVIQQAEDDASSPFVQASA
ncbi:MAG: WXG100 family type VII secretion target [Candidatus Promineifilaceae bacterium]